MLIKLLKDLQYPENDTKSYSKNITFVKLDFKSPLHTLTHALPLVFAVIFSNRLIAYGDSNEKSVQKLAIRTTKCYNNKMESERTTKSAAFGDASVFEVFFS